MCTRTLCASTRPMPTDAWLCCNKGRQATAKESTGHRSSLCRHTHTHTRHRSYEELATEHAQTKTALRDALSAREHAEESGKEVARDLSAHVERLRRQLAEATRDLSNARQAAADDGAAASRRASEAESRVRTADDRAHDAHTAQLNSEAQLERVRRVGRQWLRGARTLVSLSQAPPFLYRSGRRGSASGRTCSIEQSSPRSGPRTWRLQCV